MPLGTGQESYPHYRPYVLCQVKNATIAGELRVSKFLLENYNQVIKPFDQVI